MPAAPTVLPPLAPPPGVSRECDGLNGPRGPAPPPPGLIDTSACPAISILSFSEALAPPAPLPGALGLLRGVRRPTTRPLALLVIPLPFAPPAGLRAGDAFRAGEAFVRGPAPPAPPRPGVPALPASSPPAWGRARDGVPFPFAASRVAVDGGGDVTPPPPLSSA